MRIQQLEGAIAVLRDEKTDTVRALRERRTSLLRQKNRAKKRVMQRFAAAVEQKPYTSPDESDDEPLVTLAERDRAFQMLGAWLKQVRDDIQTQHKINFAIKHNVALDDVLGPLQFSTANWIRAVRDKKTHEILDAVWERAGQRLEDHHDPQHETSRKHELVPESKPHKKSTVCISIVLGELVHCELPRENLSLENIQAIATAVFRSLPEDDDPRDESKLACTYTIYTHLQLEGKRRMYEIKDASHLQQLLRSDLNGLKWNAEIHVMAPGINVDLEPFPQATRPAVDINFTSQRIDLSNFIMVLDVDPDVQGVPVTSFAFRELLPNCRRLAPTKVSVSREDYFKAKALEAQYLYALYESQEVTDLQQEVQKLQTEMQEFDVMFAAHKTAPSAPPIEDSPEAYAPVLALTETLQLQNHEEAKYNYEQMELPA
eukprot:TRINITY_DN47701_c0_g1_i1.p1 TRINITY_DN47701_c0_g1~~TRINITY_DN47701_c0_g1_i1.p1  ORF type:complete len:464 (-),score=35.00 TRINITY_DN47701_c0_g1_i1:203-1495(-)